MVKNEIIEFGGTVWVDVENSDEIEVTIALPTWENKNIIWLQLESLCKQETQYKWELIVCEEQTINMLGKDNLLFYSTKLKKAGCVRISYIPLNNHVPLSKKWWIISHASFGSTFLLAASDNYSPYNRIEFTHNKIKEGYDWVDISCGLFLNLFNLETSTYRNNYGETGLFMGTKTHYIKRLVGPWPKKGIDGWIRSQMDINPRYRHKDNLLGLHTDGANKISLKRRSQYEVVKKKEYGIRFNPPEQKLEDIITDEIILKKLTTSFFIDDNKISKFSKKEKVIKNRKKNKEIIPVVEKKSIKKVGVKELPKTTHTQKNVKNKRQFKKFINIRPTRIL